MLSKELCEKALEWAKTCYFEDTEGNKYSLESYSGFKCLEQLIKEHFELVEKYNTLLTRCNALENPQPYKFEDLQTEMQVYDNYLKECIEISVMCGRNRANHTVTFFRWGQEELEVVKFEKNRFFPVQMANARCE